MTHFKIHFWVDAERRDAAATLASSSDARSSYAEGCTHFLRQRPDDALFASVNVGVDDFRGRLFVVLSTGRSVPLSSTVSCWASTHTLSLSVTHSHSLSCSLSNTHTLSISLSLSQEHGWSWGTRNYEHLTKAKKLSSFLILLKSIKSKSLECQSYLFNWMNRLRTRVTWVEWMEQDHWALAPLNPNWKYKLGMFFVQLKIISMIKIDAGIS